MSEIELFVISYPLRGIKNERVTIVTIQSGQYTAFQNIYLLLQLGKIKLFTIISYVYLIFLPFSFNIYLDTKILYIQKCLLQRWRIEIYLTVMKFSREWSVYTNIIFFFSID